MTVLSVAPGSVAKRFPAGSVESWGFSGASFARSHSRAVRQTGPQATRCAPSGVEVSAASSLRSAMTRWAFACEGFSMTDCGELTREAPCEVRRLAPASARVKEPAEDEGGPQRRNAERMRKLLRNETRTRVTTLQARVGSR